LTDQHNPFATAQEVPVSAVESRHSTAESRHSVAHEAISSSPFEPESHPVSNAVSSYERLVRSALSGRRRPSNGILEQLKAWGRRLMQSVSNYARKAIEIASHKFVIELCAMIMTALLGALSKKGYRSAEVSTGDVFYRPAGAPAVAGATPQSGYRGNDSHNPFGDWTNSSHAPAWK